MSKILVISGDIWHPTEVIKAGFSYLDGYYDQMTFMEDAKDMLTADDLQHYDLVICCKGNHLTSGNKVAWFEEGVNECTPKDLEAYVHSGGAFLAVHAGASFADTNPEAHISKPCREYIDFVGCEFRTHPPRCPVTYRVLPVEHPITKGVQDFCVRDEHYQIDMTATDALVLMESTSDHAATMPAAYVREMGQGRLCTLIPGHILAVWQNPEFQKLLINAMNWCMKKGDA